MSVQLIKKDPKTGLLSIDNEGLDILKNIDADISICLIVGPYRQGKSFLMNRFISENENTFSVGDTDEPCTKGIWINKNPIKNSKNTCILFADTEGLESDDCDEAWDTKLFLLSLSISSIFLYNTKNALSNDAFKKLSVMVNLSQRIKIKSNTPTAFNNIKLKQDGPKFVWIVRDYSLKQTLKPNERLNKFLEMESESEKTGKKLDDIKTRNEIKDNMINLFKSFDCFYLRIPEFDGKLNLTLTEQLQSLNSLKFNKISKEFRQEFEEIRSFIYDNITPKEINNEKMRGQVFCEYLKSVVKLINSDECINLHDILSESVKAVAENILSKAKADYTTEMEKLFNDKNTCFNESDFLSKEKTISRNFIEFMRSNIFGSNNLAENYIKKFEEFREVKDHSGKLKGGKLFEFKERNEKQANILNDKVLNDAKNNYIEKMKKFMSSDLPKSWNSFYKSENDFSSECINSMNNNLITSNKTKYLNDFKLFKGEKSYSNKPYSGELLKFYNQNEQSIQDKNLRTANDLWETRKIDQRYSKKADFENALESLKSSLKNVLFECSDFDSFYSNFVNKKDIDRIRNSIIEPTTISSSVYPNYSSGINFQGTFSRPETKFYCPYPNCRFTSQSEHGVKVHIGRMHKEQFDCPYCPLCFSSEHGVRVHIGRMHRDDDSD
ncbi:unnamed protein product [Brachionus calyciflorus]|uniref:GB1/RHD3-type G domain-containing protein n=1 Tax=Brachionus calyciflorus TaxID=104777 RepID=A0A813V383_9BILA|nr:unnamed protein product [Brachionus calyciflorus]